MLDAYYRNGMVFLSDLLGKKNGLFSITDEIIKQKYREPVKKLVGHGNIGDSSTEKEILRLLMKYFEISGKSDEILNVSFFATKKGRCSFCGNESDVFSNRPYIFPFERKIDSITSENSRQRFCKKCGFTIYSAMAYLYQKGNVMFFFDSYNLENIRKMSIPFIQELRDPSKFNKLKNFGVPTYHPYETIFVTMFEFVKYLRRKKLINDFKDIISDVRLTMMVGSGQLYTKNYVDGNVLDKISNFFLTLMDESEKKWQKINDETKNKLRKNLAPEELIFSGFFNYLTLKKGNPSENCRLREIFTRELLNKNIDFITLNEIMMERKKENQSLPFHYLFFLTKCMEMFNMEKEMFERINGLGYALGSQMKGTNLDTFVWDVYRTRGIEQFYSSLVELQAKLKISIDLRHINEYEKGWREAKAILLNGMLNALYGGA